jgi:hypothetical protein
MNDNKKCEYKGLRTDLRNILPALSASHILQLMRLQLELIEQ